MNKKFKSLAVGVGMMVVVPTLASAVTLEGHFSGYGDHNGPGPGMYAVGTTYTAYMDLDTTQENPWYPWDQATYEYTAVLNAQVVSYDGASNPQTADFNVANVSVYRDAIAGGTAAIYSNTSTFTDGTLILSGVVQNMIGEHVNEFGLPWSVTGVIVFTGGADLGNLATQCAGGLVMNDFINFTFGTPPAGFEEAYDAEWKCPDSVSLEPTNWGRVKDLYR